MFHLLLTAAYYLVIGTSSQKVKGGYLLPAPLDSSFRGEETRGGGGGASTRC